MGTAAFGIIMSPPGHGNVNSPLFAGDVNVSGRLKITGIFDLSMAQGVDPQPWLVPQVKKRSVGTRSVLSYIMTPNNQAVLLGEPGVTYDIMLPDKLSQYVGRDYYVYSNTSGAHTIRITASANDINSNCNVNYPATTWDRDRLLPVAKFDAHPGCFMHFKVVDCGTIMRIESRCVDLCTADLSHCQHPQEDINATWASIAMGEAGNFSVKGDLSLACPAEGQVLEVGAGKPYATVKAALDKYTRQRVCPGTTIKLAPGVHESFDIESASSGAELSGSASLLSNKGLKILGDERDMVAHTWAHNAPLLSQGRRAVWTVTTNLPGVGPFVGGIPATWSTFSYPFSETHEIVVADDLLACAPLVNAAQVSGKIALIKRGACTFVSKATNTANAGAVHTIMYNSAGEPFQVGGTPMASAGVFLFISNAQGEALRTAILGAGGPVMVTITIGSIYNPPVGTQYGKVVLSHPGGNLAKIQVDIVGGSGPAENPNFILGGVVAGDRVAIVHANPSPPFGSSYPEGVEYIATIQSVAANELTLTAPVTNALTNDGSVTLLPNVRVLQYIAGGVSKPAMSVSQSSVFVKGVSFESNSSAAFLQGSSIVRCLDGAIAASNIFVYNSNAAIDNLFSQYCAITSAYSSGSDIYNGDPIVSIGRQSRLHDSRATIHSLVVPYSNYAIDIIRTKSQFFNVFVAWTDRGYISSGTYDFYIDSSHCDILGSGVFRHSTHGIVRVTAGSQFTHSGYSQLEFRDSGYWINDGDFPTLPIAAISVHDNSRVNLGVVNITGLLGYGIVVSGGSTLHTHSYSNLNIETGFDKLVVMDSSSAFIRSSNLGANDVRRTSTSEALQSGFGTTMLTGTAQTYTLDPAQEILAYLETDAFIDLANVHTGRKYKLVSTGSNNSLVLDSGAFIGEGVTSPGVNNIYDFTGAPAGHALVIEVISPTEVLVCSGGDAGSWSTVVKKRTPPAKKPKVPGGPIPQMHTSENNKPNSM